MHMCNMSQSNRLKGGTTKKSRQALQVLCLLWERGSPVADFGLFDFQKRLDTQEPIQFTFLCM